MEPLTDDAIAYYSRQAGIVAWHCARQIGVDRDEAKARAESTIAKVKDFLEQGRASC